MSELGLFLVCTVGALVCIGILLYFLTGPTSYDVIYGYEYIPEKNRVYSIKTKKFYRFKVEENYEHAVTQTVRRNLTACSLDPVARRLVEQYYPRVYKEYLCLSRHYSKL